jgi:hypothetical protein
MDNNDKGCVNDARWRRLKRVNEGWHEGCWLLVVGCWLLGVGCGVQGRRRCRCRCRCRRRRRRRVGKG